MKYAHMNALKCPDIEKYLNDPEYIAEEKYDGVRLISENGPLYTRNGNDKAAKLPAIVSQLQNVPAVLDFELYLPGKTSKDITKYIASKERQDDSQLQIAIFDILELNGICLMEWSWWKRRQQLEYICSRYNLTMTGYRRDNKAALLQKIYARGGEGVMLKNMNSEYYPGKRPANVWYKVKKHDTDDVTITGYLPGTGKNADKVGSICFEHDGLSGSCSGLSDVDRDYITENQAALLGRTMEISYMEKTDKAYRHPVFVQLRGDK
ncbi:MAG: hypothetical protein ABFC57_06205 [Veillonellales bacterium]